MIETKLVCFTCKAQSFYYMTPQAVSFAFHCVWIKVVCMYIILNYRYYNNCILVVAALSTPFNNHPAFKEIFFFSLLWSSSSQLESSFGSTAVISEIMECYHKALIQPSKKKNIIQISIKKKKAGWFLLLLLFLPYSLLPLKRFLFKFLIPSPREKLKCFSQNMLGQTCLK